MKTNLKNVKQYLISLLEFNIGKNNKVYSEDELKRFAERADAYSILFPLGVFSYSARAKKSNSPAVVKMAEKAESTAFYICLWIFGPAFLYIFFLMLFPLTWFSLIPIGLVALVVYKISKK
jgi:hypothetical protein